jgi:hypothetical protein
MNDNVLESRKGFSTEKLLISHTSNMTGVKSFHLLTFGGDLVRELQKQLLYYYSASLGKAAVRATHIGGAS